MRSIVRSKNVSWPRLIWPTVYIASPGNQPREKTIKGNMMHYGLSKSFKVIEIGTNRKPICDFLLVF